MSKHTLITITLFLLVVIITPVVETTATTNSLHHPKAGSVEVPGIIVYKDLSSKESQIDQEVLVTVEINNTGSSSIYSVSVKEPNFPNWAFETENKLDFYFVEIPAKTQRVLTYKLIPKVVETIIIPSTVITYYDKPEVDETREQFVAYSNEIVLDIQPKDLILNYEERFLYLVSFLSLVAIVFIGINTLKLKSKRTN